MTEAEELATIKLENILSALARPGGGAELVGKIQRVARAALSPPTSSPAVMTEELPKGLKQDSA